MKLRNRRTNETGELLMPDWDEHKIGVETSNCGIWYSSLADLNEEWEDYEEPKGFWCITEQGSVEEFPADLLDREAIIGNYKRIGNCFETEEEAKKAVEKLKAWKRLEDKGFRFLRDEGGRPYFGYHPSETRCIMTANESKMCDTDLDLLFGGEE